MSMAEVMGIMAARTAHDFFSPFLSVSQLFIFILLKPNLKELNTYQLTLSKDFLKPSIQLMNVGIFAFLLSEIGLFFLEYFFDTKMVRDLLYFLNALTCVNI